MMLMWDSPETAERYINRNMTVIICVLKTCLRRVGLLPFKEENEMPLHCNYYFVLIVREPHLYMMELMGNKYCRILQKHAHVPYS